MEAPLPRPVVEREPEPPPPPIGWSPGRNSRPSVCYAIWGEGFRGPGGAPLLELVKPFAINNSMSILDFGCGAGGPERAIVKEFDVWITGIQADRMQVELRQAAVLQGRPGAQGRGHRLRSGELRHPPGGFDCILSLDTLFRFESREVIWPAWRTA